METGMATGMGTGMGTGMATGMGVRQNLAGGFLVCSSWSFPRGRPGSTERVGGCSRSKMAEGPPTVPCDSVTRVGTSQAGKELMEPMTGPEGAGGQAPVREDARNLVPRCTVTLLMGSRAAPHRRAFIRHLPRCRLLSPLVWKLKRTRTRLAECPQSRAWVSDVCICSS